MKKLTVMTACLGLSACLQPSEPQGPEAEPDPTLLLHTLMNFAWANPEAEVSESGQPFRMSARATHGEENFGWWMIVTDSNVVNADPTAQDQSLEFNEPGGMVTLRFEGLAGWKLSGTCIGMPAPEDGTFEWVGNVSSAPSLAQPMEYNPDLQTYTFVTDTIDGKQPRPQIDISSQGGMSGDQWYISQCTFLPIKLTGE